MSSVDCGRSCSLDAIVLPSLWIAPYKSLMGTPVDGVVQEKSGGLESASWLSAAARNQSTWSQR